MKNVSRWALALSIATLPAFAGDAKKVEVTGYLTDTHCGAKMASKDHSDACVEKCVKGGSKVHIVADADKKMYELDSYDRVKGLVGKKVTVKGELDATSNTIKVDTAAQASSDKEKAAAPAK
jgi:hypothetical protein